MEPEHLGPEEAAQVKFHLASMTAAMSAAKATTDSVESERYWALYRQHQAEVDRLMAPDPDAPPLVKGHGPAECRTDPHRFFDGP